MCVCVCVGCLQVVMVLGASLGHVGLAVVAAWPNSAVPDLRQHNSTIYGTTIFLTTWQTDMLGKEFVVFFFLPAEYFLYME